jgi:glycosyltransferase involved in cell wall biosynthesis
MTMSAPFVIHVVVSLDYGGLEKLVVNWTNARNERFLESTMVCCLDRPGDMAKEVVGDVVSCIDAVRSRFPMDIAAVLRIRGLVRSVPNAVVHSHNLAAQQYAAIALCGTGVRHVHTEHGTNPHFGGVRNRLRTWLLQKMTDRIIAVSEDTATSLVAMQRIPRDRILVIRNGIQVSTMRSAWQASDLRASLGIPEDSTVIGSVGRLAHVKGYDRLIRAFAELVSRYPLTVNGGEGRRTEDRGQKSDTCAGGFSGTRHATCAARLPNNDSQLTHSAKLALRRVGDGPERGTLEVQAKELGVADRVIFAGYRSDVQACLAAMDLFVLSSRSEGLSVSLLEAMAAGVPVAVTDVGENWQVIEAGECGTLLLADENQWPATLAPFISDPCNARGVIGSRISDLRCQRARKRVAVMYSQDATLDEYEKLYR